MIDSIEVTEDDVTPSSNTVGTRRKPGTIRNRTTQFLQMDRKIPVLGVVLLVINLCVWIWGGGALAHTIQENSRRIDIDESASIDQVKRMNVIEQHVARIDERSQTDHETLNRIETFLMGTPVRRH